MKAKLLICLVLLLSGFDTYNFRTVRGTVTDSAAQPLPGVSVTIKGTNTGTSTDAKGHYSLPVPQTGKYLRFKIIGYKTTELKISRDSVVNVVLQDDSQSLSELVVTGFGKMAKRSSNVSMAMEMNAQPMRTFANPAPGNTENYNPIN